ncbi:MAG: autotransporter outer rane beta-barrel protein [Proteobacteria bacterium]|nr:autotransporter outer rane beta-barrel protein [Pseudomonadota bacterium]
MQKLAKNSTNITTNKYKIPRHDMSEVVRHIQEAYSLRTISLNGVTMIKLKKTVLHTAILAAIAGSAQAASTVDMVVAIDESGSMSGEHNAFIGSYIKNLDNVLNAQNVTVNRYGLGGFGGSTGQGVSSNEAGRETGWALYRNLNLGTNKSDVWGTANQFNAVTPQLETSGGTEDGYRMIDYILRNYSFRNNAGASILLITDEDRDIDTGGTPVTTGLPAGSTIYNTSGNTASNILALQSVLDQKKIVLHGVVNQRFNDKNGNTAIAIVGKDPSTGFAFVKNPTTGVVSKTSGYALGSASGTTESDYTKLALATGGTVADIDQLRSVYTDLTALNSLSQELAQIVAAISQGQTPVVGVDCSIASGSAHRLCQALLLGGNTLAPLYPSGAPTASQLNTLLPQALLNARQSIINGSRQYRRILTNRLGELLAGGGRLNAAADTASYASNNVNISGNGLAQENIRGGGASADSSSDIAFFVRGSYGEGRQSTTNGVNGYRSETFSLAIGADTRVSRDITLGAALGFIRSDADVRDLSGTGSKSDTYLVTGYGSYEFRPSWHLDGMLGYGYINLDTRRSAGGDSLVGDTRANQWFFSAGVTKDFALNEATTLKPFGRLHYTALSIDGYSEKGGLAALTYDGNNMDSLASEIGVGVRQKFDRGWAVNGSLAWEHEFNDNNRSVRTAFVADPGNAFNVNGRDVQRDYGRVTLGLSKEIDRERSLLVNLDGVVGNGSYSEYALEFKYRQSF